VAGLLEHHLLLVREAVFVPAVRALNHPERPADVDRPAKELPAGERDGRARTFAPRLGLPSTETRLEVPSELHSPRGLRNARADVAFAARVRPVQLLELRDLVVGADFIGFVCGDD